MKKKGLIVATIVMVLVLAVSLTTATYAWFTANQSATVENIGFSVTAGSDLLIGVAATNEIVASPQANGFYSGSDTTYDASQHSWSSTTNALGFTIDTNLDLRNMDKAIATGSGTAISYSVASISSFVQGTTYYTRSGSEPNYIYTAVPSNATFDGEATYYTRSGGYTIDSTWDPEHTVLKANGTGTTASTVTPETVEVAIANGTGDGTNNTVKGDYLDVTFGVQAGNDNVQSIGVVIGNKVDTDDTYLGMNAAIHVRFKVDNAENWTEYDLYQQSVYQKTNGDNDGTGINYLTKHTDMTATLVPTHEVADITWAAGDAAILIPIAAGSTNATPVGRDIHQIHIIIYVSGNDPDCNASAMGVSSTISINFVSTTITGA